MAKETIGGRPADITKEDGRVRIVFHPVSERAKHPDAVVFSIKLTKKDIDLIKGVF